MGTLEKNIIFYASDKPSWIIFGPGKLVRFRGISGESDEIILTQWMHWSLEDPCLSLEQMKLGIELAWYVHFRAWMIRGEKEKGKISYIGTQCVWPPPVTTKHWKQERPLMRWGPFTRQIKKSCMLPWLLRKGDGSQDVCWGKNEGCERWEIRTRRWQYISFFWLVILPRRNGSSKVLRRKRRNYSLQLRFLPLPYECLCKGKRSRSS